MRAAARGMEPPDRHLPQTATLEEERPMTNSHLAGIRHSGIASPCGKRAQTQPRLSGAFCFTSGTLAVDSEFPRRPHPPVCVRE